MANKVIGLIGVGKMGYGIGKTLINKGYEVHALANRNREGIDKLLEIKAHEVDSISKMADKCKIIILSLPSSAEVIEVLSGLNPIVNRKKYCGLIIDTTTGDPALSRHISEKLSATGFQYVDAPVTRGPKEAAEGRLNTILGGKADTKIEAKEIVSLYSEFIISTNGVGSAHKLKLLNNALSMGVVALSAEIFSAAEKLDISLESLKNLVQHGGVNSGLLQGFLKWSLEKSKDSLDFSIANAEKDLRYFENLCLESSYKTNITKSVHSIFKDSLEAGFGSLTIPNIINLSRK